MRMRSLPGLLPILIAAQLSAAPIQLPSTRDNSIVLLDGEWTENAGGQPRIRVKGNQHIVAIGFDTSAIAGKLVSRAALVCIPSELTLAGVTISTIAAPWDESTSNGLTGGIVGVDGWGYEGARFPAVTGGNAFTLVHSLTTEPADGVYHWEIPPDMVHALALGVAHGLAIHEQDADYSRNPTIFSREQSGRGPYLLVELDERPEARPSPPTELELTPVDGATARLTLTAPHDGFAYEITIDGVPLGRHNIPLVECGARQTIPIRDLPASLAQEGMHEIRVTTLGRTGLRSPPAMARAVLFRSAAIDTPEIQMPVAAAPPLDGLAVVPITDKFDQSGRAIGDLPADYRTHNPLFDGQRVRLIAAAGEVAGFQVLLRGMGEVAIGTRFDGPAMRVDMHQALYVPANGRMVPDPLVPLPAKLPLQPEADQAVFVDVYVPFDATPGIREGTVSLSDGRVVPVELAVLPFSLPRNATFLCEMNSYGLPDHVDDFYAVQQVAYDHRVHANILHYSHHTAAPGARKSNLDMRLPSGRRMDNRRYDDIQPGAKRAYWDNFAEAFGPYLDGSLFQHGHRGPIPAPGFYLTFHESWPLNCRVYFNGDPDAYRAFGEQPIYAETYINILRDFARLVEEKGWTETGFQVYFNNKGSLREETKAPWILDEPSSWWDYRALRFYGELTDQGRADSPETRIDYRIDISRPEFARGQLDGRADLWVVSTWAFQNYRRLVTDRIERDGLKAWVYGSSNHVHESNRDIQAWALDVWRHGGTGLVPWQTIDQTGNALKQADQLGLFILDRDSKGQTVIRHSVRLKAYREAQQLIEYLNLLRTRRGWSQDQLRRFVDHYVRLDAVVDKRDEADAGVTNYGRASPTGVESLRRAAAQLLD
jgi:hypothetical protein